MSTFEDIIETLEYATPKRASRAPPPPPRWLGMVGILTTFYQEITVIENTHVVRAFLSSSLSELPWKSGKTIHPEEWTPEMKFVAKLSKQIAKAVLALDLSVKFKVSNEHGQSQFTNSCITFNVRQLGLDWFSSQKQDPAPLLEILIRSFSTHVMNWVYFSNSVDVAAAVGSQLALEALRCPASFKVEDDVDSQLELSLVPRSRT